MGNCFKPVKANMKQEIDASHKTVTNIKPQTDAENEFKKYKYVEEKEQKQTQYNDSKANGTSDEINSEQQTKAKETVKESVPIGNTTLITNVTIPTAETDKEICDDFKYNINDTSKTNETYHISMPSISETHIQNISIDSDSNPQTELSFFELSIVEKNAYGSNDSLMVNISMDSLCRKDTKERYKEEITQLKYENETLKKEKMELKKERMELANKNTKLQQKMNEMKEKYKRKYRKKVKEKENEKKKWMDKMSVGIEIKWEWQNENYEWIEYDYDIIQAIENLFVGQLYEFICNENQQKYEIAKHSNNTAMQRNITTNVTRNCRRITVATKYPKYWNMKYANEIYGKPHLIALDLSSETAKKVCMDFCKTVPNKIIIAIETVENRMLFDKYWNEKQMLSKLIGKNKLNEKWLFHGTTTQYVMKSIIKEGFRKEFNKTAMYGKGTYFARDAKYSIEYSAMDENANYKMFVCSVICGESALGKYDYELTKWPKKSNGLIYDTLVNKLYDSSIFVIHENTRAYPMFVITFNDQ